jgi:hypothetical protein
VVVFDAAFLHELGEVTRQPGQVWAVFCMESDVTQPNLTNPGLMGRMDITMTYQRSTDIWCPYLHRRLLPDLLSPPLPKTAPEPVARVQSNNYDRSGRNAYATQLMRRIKVASYGRFARTLPDPPQPHRLVPLDSFWREVNHPGYDGEERPGDSRLWTGRARREKLDLIAPHKFTLAFENSISPDYVTEKFFDPLVAGSVPVYLGAPNVADFAPAPHAYIDTADFSGPDELAAYLNHLDQHDDEYQAYLAWKQDGFSDQFLALMAAVPDRPLCTLGEMVGKRVP